MAVAAAGHTDNRREYIPSRISTSRNCREDIYA